MKLSHLAVASACLFAITGFAQAQNVDAYFGLGTAQAPAANIQSNTLGDGNIYGGTRMGGLFGTFGGDIMINNHFGVGAESSFRFSQGAYAGLTYRPLFYDFNAIYTPTGSHKRIVPEIQGGLGGVNLSFYYPSTYCDQFVGCSSSSYYLESSHHFQVHMGAGVRFYLVGGLYLKPQVDVHWVDNFYQFGSNWVPEYTGTIGYSFGHAR